MSVEVCHLGARSRIPRRRLMRPQLSHHLSEAGATVEEVQRIIDCYKYPDDARTVLVRGLLATAMQHHRSVLLLAKRGIVHSAYALARDIIRCTRYGMWINACATREQILSIHDEDYVALSIPEMTREIETAYQGDAFFAELRDRWAAKLDRYLRETSIRAGQFCINPESGLEQEDEETGEVVTIATLCIVLLANKFLATQKHGVESKQVEALAEAYSS